MDSKNSDFLKRLQLNIQRIQSMSGQMIVKDGQRIGPGVSQTKNTITKRTVSKTKEDALIQEKYEKAVTGGLFGDDIPEGEVDKIVDKYVEKLVDELFEGM